MNVDDGCVNSVGKILLQYIHISSHHTVHLILQFYLAIIPVKRASLVAQTVKNPPEMWQTWVQSLGWEDPLEKGSATHSSILAWRIPWTAYSMGS